jgi:hypothetical protein
LYRLVCSALKPDKALKRASNGTGAGRRALNSSTQHGTRLDDMNRNKGQVASSLTINCFTSLTPSLLYSIEESTRNNINNWPF